MTICSTWVQDIFCSTSQGASFAFFVSYTQEMALTPKNIALEAHALLPLFMLRVNCYS